jgi:hypothetical protein
MRRVKIKKERLYSKERKSSRNQKKGDKTVAKHKETKRLRKVASSP